MAFERSVTESVDDLVLYVDQLISLTVSGEEIDDQTRRQRELSLRVATFKLLSDDIRDHFDWHQHQGDSTP